MRRNPEPEPESERSSKKLKLSSHAVQLVESEQKDKDTERKDIGTDIGKDDIVCSILERYLKNPKDINVQHRALFQEVFKKLHDAVVKHKVPLASFVGIATTGWDVVLFLFPGAGPSLHPGGRYHTKEGYCPKFFSGLIERVNKDEELMNDLQKFVGLHHASSTEQLVLAFLDKLNSVSPGENDDDVVTVLKQFAYCCQTFKSKDAPNLLHNSLFFRQFRFVREEPVNGQDVRENASTFTNWFEWLQTHGHNDERLASHPQKLIDNILEDLNTTNSKGVTWAIADVNNPSTNFLICGDRKVLNNVLKNARDVEKASKSLRPCGTVFHQVFSNVKDV
jgi:hypothetical protein